jgi:hypothetical protein
MQHTTLSILRWMWIIAWSILSVASIVFHAPWKIAGVCLVLLLGAVAIPRKPRRCFWAAVGLIVLVGTIWVFLPNDSQGWRPYTFENEMEAFLAKHRVPDAENAAEIYEDICRTWGEGDPNEPNVPDDWYVRTKDGPWRGEDHPAVAAWLDYHEPTVKRLGEAAGLERCFFEESIRDWLRPLYPEVVPATGIRQLAFMLVAAANRDWGERGLNASIERQSTVLKLGRHLSSQPESIFALTGAAIEVLAMEQFNRAMIQGDGDSNYLDRVAHEIAVSEADWRSTFRAILDQEKLHTKILLATGFYQVNEAGRVRYSRDPFGVSRHPLHAGRPGYWEERANRARVIMQWFVLPSDPAKMSEMIDKAYEKHAPTSGPAFDTRGQPRSSASVLLNADWSRFQWNFGYLADTMASMGQEGHAGLHTVFRRAETIRRGTLAISVLRRYKDERGSWPQDLEAIETYRKGVSRTDAWDRPFVYKPTADGFVLYSTGANGVDENGRSETEYDEENLTTTVLADDVMIWPPKGELRNRNRKISTSRY